MMAGSAPASSADQAFGFRSRQDRRRHQTPVAFEGIFQAGLSVRLGGEEFRAASASVSIRPATRQQPAHLRPSLKRDNFCQHRSDLHHDFTALRFTLIGMWCVVADESWERLDPEARIRVHAALLWLFELPLTPMPPIVCFWFGPAVAIFTGDVCPWPWLKPSLLCLSCACTPGCPLANGFFGGHLPVWCPWQSPASGSCLDGRSLLPAGLPSPDGDLPPVPHWR